MKKHIVLLMFLVSSFALQSQNKLDFTYLYDSFRQGTVKFKAGNTRNALFNYELASGKIHFNNNNTVLELGSPESIEQITIGKDTFVHIQGPTFYQKINLENIDLYINHRGVLISKGRLAGYGGHSKIASISNVGLIADEQGGVAKLEGNEKFEVKMKNNFYLKVNGKFKEFYSVNSLAKLFKKHQKEIKEALRKEKIDFSNINEVIEAVKFCGELLGK